MKPSDNMHRLFDGELSEEESRLLREAMEVDPDLSEEWDRLEAFGALHRDSIPAPKDETFVENAFLEIQNHLQPRQSATPASPLRSETSKVVFFPGSNWFKGVVAMAAVITLTLTGTWIWNLSNPPFSSSPDNSIAFVETDIAGASSMIFMDEQSGWTFVWVDEPLKNSEAAG